MRNNKTSFTVRKLKHQLYGVGQLKKSKWTLLKCQTDGVFAGLQLLYTTRRAANATAKWIRQNKQQCNF